MGNWKTASPAEIFKDGVFVLIGIVTTVVVAAADRIIVGETLLIVLVTLLVGFGTVTLLLTLSQVSNATKLSEQDLRKISESVNVTVWYVEERHRPDHEFRGNVYHELERMVRTAQSEILIIGKPLDPEASSMLDDHPARGRYLRAMEEEVRRSILERAHFQYRRVLQVPNVAQDVHNLVGATLRHHCLELSKLRRMEADRVVAMDSDETTRVHIETKKVQSQRLLASVLVDRRYLMIEVNGLSQDQDQDHKPKPYAEGMIFIEDRGGTIIRHFLAYFEEVMRKAVPASELEHAA